MSNDHFVRFENVDKSYDGKQLVVKGLDLDIAEGEFVTMLGPSGSGKSWYTKMYLLNYRKLYPENKIYTEIFAKPRNAVLIQKAAS